MNKSRARKKDATTAKTGRERTRVDNIVSMISEVNLRASEPPEPTTNYNNSIFPDEKKVKHNAVQVPIVSFAEQGKERRHGLRRVDAMVPGVVAVASKEMKYEKLRLHDVVSNKRSDDTMAEDKVVKKRTGKARGESSGQVDGVTIPGAFPIVSREKGTTSSYKTAISNERHSGIYTTVRTRREKAKAGAATEANMVAKSRARREDAKANINKRLLSSHSVELSQEDSPILTAQHYQRRRGGEEDRKIAVGFANWHSNDNEEQSNPPQLISDSEVPTNLPTVWDDEAQMDDEGGEKSLSTNKIAFCIFVVILVMGIIFGILYMGSVNDESLLSATSTPSPQDFLDALPDYTKQSLRGPASPQSFALQWLYDDPFVSTYTNDRKMARFALATFYFSTNGTNWHMDNDWLSYEVHECEWYKANQYTPGTLCRDLELHSNGLSGSIPLEIGLLTSLRWIDVANNSLAGTIPSEIGFLTNIVEINMANNAITGTIPLEIGFLTNMRILNVAHNALNGTLPKHFVRPTNLFPKSQINDLYLQNNSFNGHLPTELGLLTAMKTFNASLNSIDGKLPSHLGLLTNIEELLLQENLFTGTLPTELGRLAKMKTIGLQGNKLVGTLPTEIGRWTNNRKMELQRNYFHGILPTEIGILPSLTIDISSNNFTGSIPSEVGSLRALVLSLSDNSFTGSLPIPIFQWNDTIKHLYMDRNKLTGSIPSQIGQFSDVRHLYLYDNRLTGTLPSTLGKLTKGTEFFFQDNNFTGSIPSSLGRLYALQRLFVFHNAISGTIPPALCGRVTVAIDSYDDNDDNSNNHQLDYNCGCAINCTSVTVVGHDCSCSALFI